MKLTIIINIAKNDFLKYTLVLIRLYINRVSPDQKHQCRPVEDYENCKTDWSHDESCHISMSCHNAPHNWAMSRRHIPYEVGLQPWMNSNNVKKIIAFKLKEEINYISWEWISLIKKLIVDIYFYLLKIDHDTSFSTTWYICHLHVLW